MKKTLPNTPPVQWIGTSIPTGNRLICNHFSRIAISGWKLDLAVVNIWCIRLQQNPDVGLIGAEPYINGVAMLLGKLRQAEAQNISIHPGDVRDLFDVLPDRSVARAFLLYPDPWPKKRHHRRRFVTPEHLEPLARVLQSGAIFRVATDIPDYVRQTLEIVPKQGFEWLCEGPEDWREPWTDWISTRYEQKALREGRTPHYLTFRRL